MEEIKVQGEYIRDRGEILKIEVFEKLPYYNNERVLVKFKEYAGSNTYSLEEMAEWKHSFNIIDLIEVGDYVNGHLVTAVDRERFEVTIENMDWDIAGEDLKENEIKSIATHEQFNSIKYEVK